MSYTNSLISETSPYLLQHAHNPVNWLPWGSAAFEKATVENKLVLISIGYSSCHWCHVMEHESFKNESIAQLMNESFICIKVDREERPDVDSVYMHAVQLMTGRGGWPLNCFTLPNAKPIYGGTYFNKVQWQNILKQLAAMYKVERSKCEQYAEELTSGIKQNELIKLEGEKEKFNKKTLEDCVANWKLRLDNVEGGPQKAPKFSLPNNYVFLLRYGFLSNDAELLKHVELTLDKMAMGGIYDQVGGGFARYSTDTDWKVPHFEKMLYDNAQLISLYSEAFSLFKKPFYKKVVEETLEFLNREMRSDEGFYFSALDADSEGEEGKYYTWSKEEILAIIDKNTFVNYDKEKVVELASDYFSLNQNGYWENYQYILLRKESDEAICKKYNVHPDQLNKLIEQLKNVLLQERERRVKPGLDDKSLTSWNAIMLSALCDAAYFLNRNDLKQRAIELAELILEKQFLNNGLLFHSYKNNVSTVRGFLEDYSFVIESFIRLYEITFEDRWLIKSKEMMVYVLENFVNHETGIFYFNANDDDNLIVRKSEVQDNVIPASNSSIAKSLFYLGKHFGETKFTDHAKRLLNYFTEEIIHYGSAYSNWGLLGLHIVFPYHEIVFTGKNAKNLLREFSQSYRTNFTVAGSEKDSRLPLLKGRFLEDKNLIYLCYNNTCSLPVENIQALNFN
ncbi:MAG TPA: thioredoxin domain-containing protein [Bacteroidia bacterium]|nr:thioredoxin domain-containing protein [Bacteroidia bacterium]HNU34116.1 thioredoxin domain-containing protein [Bacteroidia bacterium]